MYIDLDKLKKDIGITKRELVNAMGVSPNTVTKWEKQKDLPAKYYLLLHEIYPHFVSLPKDFWDYTPFIIRVNMYIYGITQKDIAPVLNSYQCNLHRIFEINKTLYDYKDELDTIFPVIYIPCERDNRGKYIDMRKGENYKKILTEKV